MTDYVEHQAAGSTIEPEKVPGSTVGKVISTSSEHMIDASSDGHLSRSTDESLVDLNSQPDPVELLVGCDDDLLNTQHRTDQRHFPQVSKVMAYLHCWS